MTITLFEVKGCWDGLEWLEGQGKVGVVYLTNVVFFGSKDVYLREVVNIEFNAVGCCQFVFFAVSLKVGFFDDAEPISFLAIIAETDFGVFRISLCMTNN